MRCNSQTMKLSRWNYRDEFTAMKLPDTLNLCSNILIICCLISLQNILHDLTKYTIIILANAKQVNCFYQLFLPTFAMLSFVGIKTWAEIPKEIKENLYYNLTINKNYFSLATTPVTHKK